MAKDPICKMDVPEEGAKHMIHIAHETLYFCSKQCKEAFALQAGMKKEASGEGVIRRLLVQIARENQAIFGSTPPRYH